jgi:hypothetical protein
MPEVLKCPKCDANADVTKDGKNKHPFTILSNPLRPSPKSLVLLLTKLTGKWAHCASCKHIRKSEREQNEKAKVQS